MDFIARGSWQQAVEIYQELLSTRQTYTTDEQTAEAMNRSAWAYRQLGNFALARRLCQQSLLIRQREGEPGPIAASRLVMGTIMWTTGNTTEAARYLNLAKRLYEQANDEIGLAHVNRHTAFLYFRIGDFETTQKFLERAKETFERNNLDVDWADVLNLYARLLRRQLQNETAIEYAKMGLRLAEATGDNFVLAEIWLTLTITAYKDGTDALIKKDQNKAQHCFAQAREYYRNGYAIAKRFGYNLLLSVYESVGGSIAFEEGRYGTAFEHYVRDLEFGASYERGRMRRELDLIVNRLVQLPPDKRRFYADYVITEWEDKGLAETEPDVPRLFQLLKEYSEYV
jgi:tetratricopeptide (TPR) repeat protein